MAEYRIYIQSMYDRACGFYETYGISVFDGGVLTRIVKDVTPDREKAERLIAAFNEGDLDPTHLSQAIEDFLCG